MAALALYRLLTRLSTPALGLLLKRRLAKGKEDPARIQERRGIASRSRPDGPLVWLHAASVGEAQSALSLIGWLTARPEPVKVLVTSGTVTSAHLLDERLPEDGFHQFIPLDSPGWVDRFLDHWRPDLALWIESELWPNLLTEIGRRKIPAVLINARLSPKSYANWQRFPGIAARLLRCFELCLAQSEQQATWLQSLGAAEVACVGNLKYAAAPLAAEAEVLGEMQRAVAERTLWLAASTHEGEEALVATVHKRLRDRHPKLLTIIAPRHPARAADIATELQRLGLQTCRRSRGDTPGPEVDIYLADTMGELGLFYRLAPIAVIGGSFGDVGGHNLTEPAQLGCAILHGPDMRKTQAVADEMAAAGGALECDNAEALAEALDRLLRNADERQSLATAAKAVADAHGDVLARIGDLISPYLNRLRGGTS